MFDGRTSAGWRGANKSAFPEKGWEISDGVLTVLGEKGGDIVTEKQFGDFDLSLEFKNTPGANSGVKYYVLEGGYRKGQVLGVEFQTADTGSDRNDTKSIGSAYDILRADVKEVKPAGEWNHMRIVSKDKIVQHWLNGYKILEYERGGAAFRQGVATSKFKDIKNFGEAPRGHILLQDHGNEVSFRNIKIREFR